MPAGHTLAGDWSLVTPPGCGTSQHCPHTHLAVLSMTMLQSASASCLAPNNDQAPSNTGTSAIFYNALSLSLSLFSAAPPPSVAALLVRLSCRGMSVLGHVFIGLDAETFRAGQNVRAVWHRVQRMTPSQVTGKVVLVLFAPLKLSSLALRLTHTYKSLLPTGSSSAGLARLSIGSREEEIPPSPEETLVRWAAGPLADAPLSAQLFEEEFTLWTGDGAAPDEGGSPAAEPTSGFPEGDGRALERRVDGVQVRLCCRSRFRSPTAGPMRGWGHSPGRARAGRWPRACRC